MRALLDALKDPDRDVREYVVRALGQKGDPAAAPALLEVLSYDPDFNFRGYAADALGKIKDRAAVAALAEATRDEVSQVRGYAFDALSAIGGAEAVAALGKALRTGDERAAMALGKLKDPAAVPALIAALKDPDVGESASEALDRIGTAEARAAAQAFRRSQAASAAPEGSDRTQVGADQHRSHLLGSPLGDSPKRKLAGRRGYFRERTTASPTNPKPKSAKVAGSGTGWGSLEKVPAWMKTPASRIWSEVSATAIFIVCVPAPSPSLLAWRTVVRPSKWMARFRLGYPFVLLTLFRYKPEFRVGLMLFTVTGLLSGKTAILLPSTKKPKTSLN